MVDFIPLLRAPGRQEQIPRCEIDDQEDSSVVRDGWGAGFSEYSTVSGGYAVVR